MAPDEFCRMIRGTPLVALDAAIRITGVALRPDEAGPEQVFFAFCQQDYAANCFNGSFADAADESMVSGLIARGTRLCVLRRENYERHSAWLQPYRQYLIVVDDAIAAFQRFAGGMLARRRVPVIGITGSAGKTTTKELIAHILSGLGRRPLYTAGNQNNGIGVPLTVLRLLEHDTLVLEMGMSTGDDEIARLCRVAPPDVAVVLNVMAVHMEYLLTLDGVERAKSQIVEGLATGGVAVLNGDDPRAAAMRAKAGRSLTFGLGAHNDVRASALGFSLAGSAFTLHHGGRAVAVTSPLNGQYNVLNMLAACAASLALEPDCDLGLLARQLATFEAPPQRGRQIMLNNGVVLIDDTYNANPQSLLLAAQAALALAEPGGRLIVVAGSMHELGGESYRLHVEAGAALAALGTACLFAIGRDAGGLIEGFGSGSACSGVGELAAALNAQLAPGDVVLIKGSRAERLERLVQALGGTA